MKWLHNVLKQCFCFHQRFNPAELTFLTEFAAVMSPVAQATDILQPEENVRMWWRLPTIILLTAKHDMSQVAIELLQAYG